MPGRARSIVAAAALLPALLACTPAPAPAPMEPVAAPAGPRPVLTPAPVGARPALGSGFDGARIYYPSPANLDSSYNPTGSYMVRRR